MYLLPFFDIPVIALPQNNRGRPRRDAHPTWTWDGRDVPVIRR
jgi:hypothetical protein